MLKEMLAAHIIAPIRLYAEAQFAAGINNQQKRVAWGKWVYFGLACAKAIGIICTEDECSCLEMLTFWLYQVKFILQVFFCLFVCFFFTLKEVVILSYS